MGGATLIIDLGVTTAAAMVVTDQGSWLLPDPVSGEVRWAHSLHPAEPAAEFFAVLRQAAQRLLGSTPQGMLPGSIERAVITIPASLGVTDPVRGKLVSAAEAAGFSAVELLLDAAAAVRAPGSPLRVGDTALVYDLTLRHEGATQRGTNEERTGPGPATFEAALVRVGDDLPDLLGHASIADWPADPVLAIDLTLACCRDLLDRAGVNRVHVNWVLTVGGGARAAGLRPALDGLGIPVAQVDEPELAVVRGAAAWLPRSGSRTVPARPAGGRMVPLAFTIPGGGARLLRWLVEPQHQFDEGATVARVRLSDGAIWDLTARAPGVLDEVLVPGGTDVRSGDWLALVRPR